MHEDAKVFCCTSVVTEPRLHVLGQWSGSGVAALRTRSTRDQHAVSSAIDAMKPRYRRDEAAVSLDNATFPPTFKHVQTYF